MLGGTVIEVSELRSHAGKIFIDCLEFANGMVKRNAILVYADENSKSVQIGDMLHWRGKIACWTPSKSLDTECSKHKQGKDYDIRLHIVGKCKVHPDNAFLVAQDNLTKKEK